MRRRKHVWILGCPAVGKLTTARSLSKLLDYPVFDNAKVVDLVSLIHPYGTTEFRVYRDFLRYSFYGEVLKNSSVIGLISTNVLRHPDNWTYFESVEKIFQDSGWETKYILITASNEELLNRATSESRKSKRTIDTREQLLVWLKNNPLCNSIKEHVCHVIDTTELDAGNTAIKIKSLLSLDNDY